MTETTAPFLYTDEYDQFVSKNSLWQPVTVTTSNSDAIIASGSVWFDQTTMNVLNTNQDMQSWNFVSWTSWWQIKGDWDVEFWSWSFRWNISATTGTIWWFTIASNKLYWWTIQTSESVWVGWNWVIMDTDWIRWYSAILWNVFNLPTDWSAPTFSSWVINTTTFNVSSSWIIRTSDRVWDWSIASNWILVNNTWLFACWINQTPSTANVRLLTDWSIYLKNAILYSSIPNAITITYWSNILLEEGWDLNFTSVPDATAPTATLITTSTGNVDNWTHSYAVIFATESNEETGLWVVSNSVTVDATHKKVEVSDLPYSPSIAVKIRKIYRTKAGGSDFYFLMTIPNNLDINSFTDNLADSSLLGSALTSKFNETYGKIKVDGIEVINVNPQNVFIGKDAWAITSWWNIVSWERNVAIWSSTLSWLTTWQSNIALWFSALYRNTSWNENIAMGYYSMLWTYLSDSTWSNNVALWTYSLKDNIGGHRNIAIGYLPGSTNTEWDDNVAIWTRALNNNLIWNRNIAIGNYAWSEEMWSDALYIDNQYRPWANKTGSLIYGQFNATPLSQQITFNVWTLNILDWWNISTWTTTGLKIWTSTSQKLWFYNATPVDQPATVADATDAASVILRCNDIIARLKELWLIA